MLATVVLTTVCGMIIFGCGYICGMIYGRELSRREYVRKLMKGSSMFMEK